MIAGRTSVAEAVAREILVWPGGLPLPVRVFRGVGSAPRAEVLGQLAGELLPALVAIFLVGMLWLLTP